MSDSTEGSALGVWGSSPFGRTIAKRVSSGSGEGGPYSFLDNRPVSGADPTELQTAGGQQVRNGWYYDPDRGMYLCPDTGEYSATARGRCNAVPAPLPPEWSGTSYPRGSGWRVAYILEQYGTYRLLYAKEASQLVEWNKVLSDNGIAAWRGDLKAKYQRVTPPEVEAALRAYAKGKYELRGPTGSFNPGKTDTRLNTAAKSCKVAGRVLVVVMLYSEFGQISSSDDWQRQLGASGSGVLGGIGGGSLGGAGVGGLLGALGLNPFTVAVGAFIGGVVGGAAGYELGSGSYKHLWDVVWEKPRDR